MVTEALDPVDRNILVTLTSVATATATTYFTTYRVDGHTDGFMPPRAPTQVGHYEDAFLKVDGLWLLRSRSSFLAFAGPSERLEPADKP
ncbi:nuclear transport factor 2 family protein [Streptomyces lydicamycinicus]|uniref:nuclear transport factor 2 family protein n=1 Tax=Streptomyces lydicamycinicus TaxID=1546107 RepID=UPI003C2AC2EC